MSIGSYYISPLPSLQQPCVRLANSSFFVESTSVILAFLALHIFSAFLSPVLHQERRSIHTSFRESKRRHEQVILLLIRASTARTARALGNIVHHRLDIVFSHSTLVTPSQSLTCFALAD